MYDSLAPSHYHYLVSLRDAKRRYFSHYRQVVPSGTPSFRLWLQGQPDNWTLRHLCGEKCASIPKFGITPSLFQYTISRLQHFDVIFADGEKFVPSFNRFAMKLGWKIMHRNYKSNTGSVQAYDLNAVFENWDERMTHLDDALYHFATAMYNGEQAPNLNIVWGPKTHCINPCCGKCSAY